MKEDRKKELEGVVQYFLNTPEGVVVEHSKLRMFANILDPAMEQFESQEEFLEAVKDAEFQYMSFTEDLKELLLSEHKVCLKNEKGVGYYALPPKEQIEYGIRKAKEGIRKKVKQGRNILENVRWNSVSVNDRKHANDSAARLSMLRQMMSGR